jgi:hypothetical protein
MEIAFEMSKKRDAAKLDRGIRAKRSTKHILKESK